MVLLGKKIQFDKHRLYVETYCIHLKYCLKKIRVPHDAYDSPFTLILKLINQYAIFK